MVVRKEKSGRADITGGLLPVVKLFEARKPRATAVISETGGVAKHGGIGKHIGPIAWQMTRWVKIEDVVDRDRPTRDALRKVFPSTSSVAVRTVPSRPSCLSNP